MGGYCQVLVRPDLAASLCTQAAGTSGASAVATTVTVNLYPAAALAVGTGQMGILPGACCAQSRAGVCARHSPLVYGQERRPSAPR